MQYRAVRSLLRVSFLILILTSIASAEIRLSGSILSEIEKKPVEFGTLIVVEEKKKYNLKVDDSL